MFLDCHSHLNSGNTIYNRPYQCINTINGLSSYGLHPWDCEKDSNQTIFQTLQQLATTKQINFVGECGLDSKLCNVPLSIQEMWFKRQIEVSETYHLPLILHCVNEIEHVRRIRKEINAQQCWIFHGFNGSYQLTQTLIKEGFVISFGRAILNENNMKINKPLQHAFKEQKLLLETDNEEGRVFSISEIYNKTSQRLNTPVEVIEKEITQLISKLTKRIKKEMN